LTPQIARKQFEPAFASGTACTKGVSRLKNGFPNLESLGDCFPRWVFRGKNQRNSWQFIAKRKIHKLLYKNNRLNGLRLLLYLAIPNNSQSLFSL
jgi:hypothetical protein